MKTMAERLVDDVAHLEWLRSTARVLESNCGQRHLSHPQVHGRKMLQCITKIVAVHEKTKLYVQPFEAT